MPMSAQRVGLSTCPLCTSITNASRPWMPDEQPRKTRKEASASSSPAATAGLDCRSRRPAPGGMARMARTPKPEGSLRSLKTVSVLLKLWKAGVARCKATRIAARTIHVSGLRQLDLRRTGRRSSGLWLAAAAAGTFKFKAPKPRRLPRAPSEPEACFACRSCPQESRTAMIFLRSGC